MRTEFRIMKQIHPATDKPFSLNRVGIQGASEHVTWLGIEYATRLDASIAKAHQELVLNEKVQRNSFYGAYREF